MHDRAGVVGLAQVVDGVLVHHLEVVPHGLLDVVPQDVDETVSV